SAPQTPRDHEPPWFNPEGIGPKAQGCEACHVPRGHELPWVWLEKNSYPEGVAALHQTRVRVPFNREVHGKEFLNLCSEIDFENPSNRRAGLAPSESQRAPFEHRP